MVPKWENSIRFWKKIILHKQRKWFSFSMKYLDYTSQKQYNAQIYKHHIFIVIAYT